MASHVIENRPAEISVAIILVLVGCFLVWDAFDNRNKQLPWFARWFSFW